MSIQSCFQVVDVALVGTDPTVHGSDVAVVTTEPGVVVIESVDVTIDGGLRRLQRRLKRLDGGVHVGVRLESFGDFVDQLLINI